MDVLVPVILPLASSDYIDTYGTATLYLEYGTATPPADGTATRTIVSGTERYEFWVAAASDYDYRFRIGDASTFTDYSATWQMPLAYATIADVARGLDLPDESRYDELDGLLVQATDYISNVVCGGRRFFRDPLGTGTTTLDLDIDHRGQHTLSLARGRELDIVSLTSMSIAAYTGQSYDSVSDGSDGFYLLPDAPRHGHPYDDVVLSDVAPTYAWFPTGRRTVRLVGVFGWAAVPELVRRATIDLVRWMWNSRGREGEPVGLSTFGAPIFSGMPKTVRELAHSEYAWKRWVG